MMEKEMNVSQETATLVKRLAGPSSGKAGLALDQSEINRIIADVSKGSKFYENEKKKDKELTERINQMLKIKDEAFQGTDIERVEAAVDKLVAQIEAQRDLGQTIVHVDMDAFYANVELLDNPDLQGKPFGVGMSVLTTASYEARKYGVRSGMAGFVAKKLCPNLILVKNNFARYMEVSAMIMDVFKRYDPQMQITGCDEGYLNITEYCTQHRISAENCVKEMRQIVFEETKLTVSAGIAPNKMLAKICSERNKPNGQFQLGFDQGSIKAFMYDLSIRKVPFIGRVNERMLDSLGIKTCGDIYIQRAALFVLDKHFDLPFLLRTYLGIASNEVRPPAREERKSIGAERSFTPTGDLETILQKLQDIADELESDMVRTGWTGRTVTLKFKLDTYQVFTRAKSFNNYIAISKEGLFAEGKELLLPELPLKLRLIGLRITKLKDLRVPSSSSGIKRFFDSIQADEMNKKRRKDPSDVIGNQQRQDVAADAQWDMSEGAFLGYFEDDSEVYPHDRLNEDTDSRESVQKPQPLPPEARECSPTSATHRPPQDLKMKKRRLSISNATPRIKSRRNSSSEVVPMASTTRGDASPSSSQLLVCPMCKKMLETDNQGLNAHIDFCLSRGAILEAQAEASSPVKKRVSVKSGDLRSKDTRPTTQARFFCTSGNER